jgi:hypothetical protein
MPQVNLIAVLLCGVASLVLGGLWYSPMLFAKSWQSGASLSDEQAKSGNPLSGAVGAGFAAGLCWVGASFGINYLFERRPLGLWLINGGYHTLQFTLFGLILGAIH